jgi:outer membrane biosynthesis protein TonB
MAVTGNRLESLRFNRFDNRRLAIALAISIAAHLAIFGSYELSKELARIPWMRMLARKLAYPAPVPVTKTPEQPLEFVMVQNPSPTAPDNAKYYSSQNSRAADSTHRDSDIAEIRGAQDNVPQTSQAPRPEFNKLQPTPQPEQAQPLPTTDPGDLTLAKLEELRPQQQQQRPRTLAQVRPNQVPGLLMHQVGGAHEVSLRPTLDAKSTAFGAYDEAFIDAVETRWFQLLDSQQFAYDRTGSVTLSFHLNYDGSITDMQILQNSVGELLGTLCEDSITDPTPFAAWPEDMRRMVGANYREITFTFYYY